MRIKKSLVAGLLSSLAAIAVMYFAVRESESVATQTGTPTASSAPQPTTSSAPIQAPVEPASSMPKNQPASPASQVSALVTTGQPVAYFGAYKIIARCLRAKTVQAQMPAATSVSRPWMAKEPSVEAACGDISPGLIASRLRYLEIAAEANIPGAAMEFLKEGPYGDPVLNVTANDNDPAVAAWSVKSRMYVKAAAERGELSAIANMSNFYQFTEPNPALALRYFAAQVELMKGDATGNNAITIEQTFKALRKNLSTSAAEEAIASGKKLAQASTTKGS